MTNAIRLFLCATVLSAISGCGGDGGGPRETLVLEPGVSAKVVPGNDLIVEGPYVVVETEGHVIRVSPKNGKSAAHAYVEHPGLEVVRTRGNAEADVEVDGRRVDVDAAGTSRVVMNGDAAWLVVTLRGDAVLDASGVTAENADVDLSGSASGDVYATETVDGRVTGDASLVVRGGASLLGLEREGNAQVTVE